MLKMFNPLIWTIGSLGILSFVLGLEMGHSRAADPPPSKKASVASVPASRPTTAASRPALKVEKDGFPSGHDTPEGVACDLARAFINRDVKLFRDTCIPPFGGGESRKDYEAFLKERESDITAETAKAQPSPGGPKSLAKCFAARHLSKDGPASAGYALFEFNDIMFVDVRVLMHNGKHVLVRTMVICTKDNKWYAHPAPDTAQLLSMGLNDESPSKIDFTEVYDVKK
ncbi:MAG: hypothetical protein FWD61_04470 [Phycisphaerales bacterium]|nr:hypothetical protein [Phycisphaerales bacterium]